MTDQTPEQWAEAKLDEYYVARHRKSQFGVPDIVSELAALKELEIRLHRLRAWAVAVSPGWDTFEQGVSAGAKRALEILEAR